MIVDSYCNITLTTCAKMQIYNTLAVKYQHASDQVRMTTYISDAVALLLQLDQLFGWYDRHGDKILLGCD